MKVEYTRPIHEEIFLSQPYQDAFTVAWYLLGVYRTNEFAGHVNTLLTISAAALASSLQQAIKCGSCKRLVENEIVSIPLATARLKASEIVLGRSRSGYTF